jgi:hypothetical protein
MNAIDRKVMEMTSRFGRDMAISQAAFHVSRARGAVRRWWEAVLMSLQRAEMPVSIVPK